MTDQMRQAIDEIMLVATFDTRQARRDALEAAYSAGFADARGDGVNPVCENADCGNPLMPDDIDGICSYCAERDDNV
jgi:hypothetical protein